MVMWPKRTNDIMFKNAGDIQRKAVSQEIS